ncbi:MAG TPA: hypothetical protein VF355_01500 [Anaerolineaceae bacterium]
MPAAGGKIERVTNVNDTGLFAVNTDGTDLVKLSDEPFEGNIQWLP